MVISFIIIFLIFYYVFDYTVKERRGKKAIKYKPRSYDFQIY